MNELKDTTVKGISWSVVNQIFQLAFKTLSHIVIARLLTPDDYGVIGMVTVFSGFATLLLDFGLGSALIQNQQVTQRALSSVFWFNVLVGLIFFLIQVLAAPLLASFYKMPKLESITIALGALFVINGLYAVQSSLFLKRIDMKTPFIINMVSLVISFVITIILAAYGYGAWSLVWQIIASSIISCVFFWVKGNWRPSLVFDWMEIRNLMRFSLNLVGFKSLNYWSRNVDNFLIGKMLGPSSLGVYSKAYGFLLLPINNVAGVVSKSLFPAFSMIQDDKKRIKRIYLLMTQSVAFITFPLMVVLLVAADSMVVALFGKQWISMVPILRYFALAGIPQSILTLVGNVYMSQGRTDLQFKVGGIFSIVGILFMIVGLYWGLMGIVIAHTLSSYLLFLPNYHYAARLIGLSLYELLISLKEIIGLAFAMLLVMVIMYHFIHELIPPFYEFVLLTTAGLLFYTIAAKLFNVKIFKELLVIVRQRFAAR
jgi:O-antigen/teichoic acid export membrane protein